MLLAIKYKGWYSVIGNPVLEAVGRSKGFTSGSSVKLYFKAIISLPYHIEHKEKDKAKYDKHYYYYILCGPIYEE